MFVCFCKHLELESGMSNEQMARNLWPERGFLRGEFNFDELHEKICTATWQYARRQRTWFRHQHPEAENFCGGVEDLLLRFLRHETP